MKTYRMPLNFSNKKYKHVRIISYSFITNNNYYHFGICLPELRLIFDKVNLSNKFVNIQKNYIEVEEVENWKDGKMIDINKIEFKKFPGGELHITDTWKQHWEATRYDNEQAICRIQNSDDLMKLCLFTDAFKRVFEKLPRLVIPYFPYARQDRVPAEGEALSVKVFANIINSLGYPSVTILDPHSDVCTALIENVEVVPQWNIWGSQLVKWSAENSLDGFDLIAPDAGALKKIYKLQEFVGNSRCKNVRVGTKHRDTQTGKITGTSVDGQPFSKTGIIVDDICDGGRTFIELGKVIRKDYDRLILCVTHGIFSKGLEPLDVFDEIYSVDTWNGQLEDFMNLKVIKLNEL